MNKPDQIADANAQWWEKMVAENCGFTQPWLDLEREVLEQYAKGQLENVPKPLDEIYPPEILADVAGKDVLCLASGGGQQSAVFGLLGANVTVVDITAGQLAGDRQAAEHYGYPVRTVQADMRDLSALEDACFDLVFQAPSMAYVPDVGPVYAEVGRVLRPGGLYRADAQHPVTQFVDTDVWDEGYRIHVPYGVRQVEQTGEGAREFRHYLDEIFNGLIAAGFMIRQVAEAPYHIRYDPDAEPGSWEHILMHVPWSFAIIVHKLS
ncbi:MAG: class I SAM-dependent methyltransferase [Anaerolineales bacterium]|nr:class I SAM-dependent methyltransferase [Anaerolineales bacterium]